jgi:hypothetical protein
MTGSVSLEVANEGRVMNRLSELAKFAYVGEWKPL